jgi:type VI secretion system protein ImpL
LSPTTLEQFQVAAEIRDAFFQTGGNLPFVQLAVKPDFIASGVAKLEIGGSVITSPPTNDSSGAAFGPASIIPALRPRSQPSPVAPVLVQWPGAALNAEVSAAPDQNSTPSVLERAGPWAMFRLLEAGGVTAHGETARASFAVGGYVLQFTFISGATRNPLNLAVLRNFRCPSGI